MTATRLICFGTVLALALALAGCGNGSSESTMTPGAGAPAATSGEATTRTTSSGYSASSAAEPRRTFRLGATAACLRARSTIVTLIVHADRRLRAMGDLAQKTSRQVRSGRQVVGVAFGRTTNDAVLLVDLLRVQNDPYRLERKGNVVLLYARSSERLRATVRGCLR